MCRNIKTLFNFDPPATNEEIYLSSQQFVRKLSGFSKPSKINEELFERAIQDVAAIARKLVDNLETNAAPKNRETESSKAKARALARFARHAEST